MSRTYKHIKAAKSKRSRESRWEAEYERIEYLGKVYSWPNMYDSEFRVRICYMKKAGVLTKKRKEVDTEDHWMTTPMWWNRLQHTRPERREVTVKCGNAIKSNTDSLEDLDIPNTGRKPHIYYW